MDVLDVHFSLLQDGCQQSVSNSEHITQFNSTDVPYEHFFADYLYKNRPCLVKNVSENWGSQNDWITEGKPNFELLRSKYGEAEVPVSDCNDRYFNAQSKCTMKLKDFLDYWQDYTVPGCDSNAQCLYMKDWHFAIAHSDEDAYRVPSFFASDWLNEYLLRDPSSKDDYRFVYMGPKGSWTPLHADVFSSFSWSVNICGRKKWIFFPPGQEELLKDKFGKLAFDVDGEELNDITKYPRYSSSVDKIVFIQEVGDAIFVPSGWHHQVWNLENTISFNHNWVNGCNVDKMWSSINDCLMKVSQEIRDCEDMEGWDDQCQLLLKSCFGMDHTDFYKFVDYITRSRLDHLKSGSNLRVNGGWTMSKNHMIFDLSRLKHLLAQMVDSNVPCYNNLMDELELLISAIDDVILYIFKTTIAFT